MTQRAFYFGCYGNTGHHLRGFGSRRTLCDPIRQICGFPLVLPELDGALLKARGVPDEYDGRVYWQTSENGKWLAFVWWDRSGDSRPGSNSGFYVIGFTALELQAAFDFACAQWAEVVARQTVPLVLEGAAT